MRLDTKRRRLAAVKPGILSLRDRIKDSPSHLHQGSTTGAGIRCHPPNVPCSTPSVMALTSLVRDRYPWFHYSAGSNEPGAY